MKNKLLLIFWIVLGIVIIISPIFLITSTCFGEEITSVNDLIKQYNTPEKICKWEQNNIKYIYAYTDKWLSSEEVLQRKESDCKGFAVLTYEAVNKLNYKAYIVLLNHKTAGHCVVIFKRNSKWEIISNGNLLNYRTTDFVDLFKIFINYNTQVFINPKGRIIFERIEA